MTDNNQGQNTIKHISELASEILGSAYVQERHTDHDDSVVVLNPNKQDDTAVRPRELVLSREKDGNYYMSIDSHNWEFDDSESVATDTALKYIKAMKEDLIRIKSKRRFIPRSITIGSDLYVIDKKSKK